MSRYRLTTIVVLLALALCCAFSTAAIASSTLLSGYGGPGQGNQAILGSTLIGGAGGGSGGGSAGTSGAPGTVPSLAVEERHATSSGGGGARGSGGFHRGGSQASRAAKAGASSATGAAAATLAAERVDAPALGVSGSDLAYIVLAFLVLVLTALLSVFVMRHGSADRAAGEG
jgi:hypothetical protein